MATRLSRTTLVSALVVATALALVALGLAAITNAGAPRPAPPPLLRPIRPPRRPTSCRDT